MNYREVRSFEMRNIIALVKDNTGERFIFLYDDQSSDRLLQTFGRYAADTELNFSWYDAAMLSQKVREVTVAMGK